MLSESNISLGPARDWLRHECLLRGGAVNRQPDYRARNLQRTAASEGTDVVVAITAATTGWGLPTATIATRVALQEYCNSRSKGGTPGTLRRSQQGGPAWNTATIATRGVRHEY